MKLRLKGHKNVYEEIAEQYKNYILLGVLAEGEKLPSCRELAIELGINPNTVERAYSHLEAERLVVTMPKKGTYVLKAGDRGDELKAEAKRQILALKDAGLSERDMIAIVKQGYKE